MFRSKTPLILLPGLGCDKRCYAPQSNYFQNTIHPVLPQEDLTDTLQTFAQKCVQKWVDGSEKVFDISKPFVLGGTGLGGMLALEVALEISKHVKPTAVLLIGSARSKSYIPPSFRFQAKLANLAPEFLGRWQLKQMWKALAKKESISADHTRLMQEMARDVSWKSFLWQLKAIATWNRDRQDFESAGFPIHQIHGRLDRLLIVPAVEDATLLLNSQHLITLSAVDQVNRWIESIIRNIDLIPQP